MLQIFQVNQRRLSRNCSKNLMIEQRGQEADPLQLQVWDTTINAQYFENFHFCQCCCYKFL